GLCICAVGAARLGAETVEALVFVLRAVPGELEHDAVARIAAEQGRAVEIAFGVAYQPRRGLAPIRATALRAERIERLELRFRPARDRNQRGKYEQPAAHALKAPARRRLRRRNGACDCRRRRLPCRR